MAGSQAKHWCFTLNNPEAGLLMDSFTDLAYGVYQQEIGENGTPHFQGFLMFTKRKRFNQVKALPGLQRAHLEVRRGTPQQARAYAMKLETRQADTLPVEHGVFDDQVTQGERERTRLTTIFIHFK